jgi:transcriptional regulator with XRE-family HTH domain
MTATRAPKLATEADRTIGSRIAALRSAQGLSQTMLGQAIGVSFQQVQKYEKGRNRIGAGRLQAIADLTGWLWTGLIERISLDQRSWG